MGDCSRRVSMGPDLSFHAKLPAQGKGYPCAGGDSITGRRGKSQMENRNLTRKKIRWGLLFQFYAPRYCLRQARVSDGDSQNRTSSVCLRQTLCLKEKQKGQPLYFLAWRCLLSSTFAEEGTNLSDAPAKAMLRILRFARRRCWAFLLFRSLLHASRSGCCADGDCWVICAAS